MELIKRNIHMDSLKCKASMQTTLEDDVIISDSRPDAAKLILDRGNVIIEEIKVTDDHVNVKGKLEFYILYQTEGKADLADMSGAVPFNETIFMEGVQSGDNVSVDWEIEDLTVSMINSRKLSVQSVLSFHGACEEIFDEEIAVDLYSEDPVEFRKKTVDVAAMAVKKKDVFRIKEEVEIPGSFPNIFSMIWWEIVPGAVEFKVLEDKISVQGELKTFFLYRGEGEEEDVCHYETTLPFAGALDCSGVREGMIPEIKYKAENRELEVRPDFDGEERVITFEECLELEICVYEEEQLDILSDVYGVVKEVSVLSKEAELKKLLSKCSGKTKVSGQFATQDESTSLHKILHTSHNLQLADQTILDEGIQITGTVDVRVFYEGGNEMVPYGTIEGSIPFTYVLEAPGVDEKCICPVQAFVDQMTVSIIDAGEVDVKCVLFFRANVYRRQQEKLIEQISVSEPDAEKLAALPGIAVYMVKEGESLWDIGKRYYVPISALKQMNELSGDEVVAGDKILVVKG